MRILVTICARGGSKGIPGKNIKELAGKPLIAYSINVARQFANAFGGVDIALSTDSDQILDAAAGCGLISEYRRPATLAGDTIGKIDAILDVVQFYEYKNQIQYDYVLDLDVTSPLRNLTDLTNAFEILRKDESAVNLFSVSPASRSPYFNMVEKQKNGYYGLIKKTEGDSILARQSAPKVYDMNASFYFYKRNFFDIGYRTAITNNTLIYLVPHMCFDLDHPIDFEYMTFLFENKKLDFKL